MWEVRLPLNPRSQPAQQNQRNLLRTLVLAQVGRDRQRQRCATEIGQRNPQKSESKQRGAVAI